MDTTTVPASPATRELARTLRGLALYRDHVDEIVRILPHTYSVPSCSGSTSYVVRLDRGTCECPDHERHPELTCKHLAAATVAASKKTRRRRSA